MIKSLKNWVEDRTGLLGHTKNFLNERIPRSTGWRNTLGSAAGALLLIQFLSGVLMMLFYVPHPNAAYESVQFVEGGLLGGSFVRAMHYWGASFIIVALFVHLVRVFLSGAYKKPREVTWLVGLALLGIVFALAFTGQLLPWNQDGYWAAKVGVEIGASAPILGPYVRHALLAGDSIGALTLTRFFTLHVVILPALLSVLLLFHLYLLRRHGPTPAPDSAPEEEDRFFPLQTARDAIIVKIGRAHV